MTKSEITIGSGVNIHGRENGTGLISQKIKAVPFSVPPKTDPPRAQPGPLADPRAGRLARLGE